MISVFGPGCLRLPGWGTALATLPGQVTRQCEGRLCQPRCLQGLRAKAALYEVIPPRFAHRERGRSRPHGGTVIVHDLWLRARLIHRPGSGAAGRRAQHSRLHEDHQEKVSGGTAEKPQLKRAIGGLDAGDVLMVTSTDPATPVTCRTSSMQ